MTDLIKIRVDDILLTLTAKTLSKYKNSLLYKIVNSNVTSDFIHKESNVLYIDMDPISLKHIINHVRGYEIPEDILQNKTLMNKLIYDGTRLGFDDFVSTIKKHTPDNKEKPFAEIDSKITNLFLKKLNTLNNASNNSTFSDIKEFSNDPLTENTSSANMIKKIIRPKKQIFDV